MENIRRKDLLCQQVSKMSHVLVYSKLVPPLLKYIFFTISQPILYITAQIRCSDPCFQGHRHSPVLTTCVSDMPCNLLCLRYRKYDVSLYLSQYCSNLRGFYVLRAWIYKIELFLRPNDKLGINLRYCIRNSTTFIYICTNSFIVLSKQRARMIFSELPR